MHVCLTAAGRRGLTAVAPVTRARDDVPLPGYYAGKRYCAVGVAVLPHTHREESEGETQMTGAEATVERQELGERVLGIIGGYRMGTALNAQDLFTKTAPEALPSDTVLAGDERRTLAT